PFSLKLPKNYHFIEIYLHKLNDDYKIKLDEYLTQNDIIPSNTLFNYPSFIQRLDAYEIINSINEWSRTIETSKTKVQRSGYLMRNKLLSSQIINFTKLIYKSLFIIFIENEVNLYSFEVMLFNNTRFEYFDEILELILQNPNFICNIKNFEINFYEVTENTRFSKFLYSNCNSISSLYLQYSFYHFQVTDKCSSLSQIIQSQINLRKLLLENFGIISSEPQQLLQLIIKYCSKIKFLGPISMNNKSSYLLFNLVENITQNLDYLFIETSITDISSIILKNLGQILPHKLEYLHLSLTINRIDFEIFLKNFQNTFVKKLLIRNRKRGKNGDIFPFIKEYMGTCLAKQGVKEFELYDIQVLCYKDLSIDIYDFLKEVD
ncbi:hypothetical protein RhiirB3_451755, partial [Rhizophagus irregularis]